MVGWDIIRNMRGGLPRSAEKCVQSATSKLYSLGEVVSLDLQRCIKEASDDVNKHNQCICKLPLYNNNNYNNYNNYNNIFNFWVGASCCEADVISFSSESSALNVNRTSVVDLKAACMAKCETRNGAMRNGFNFYIFVLITTGILGVI
eukprot:GHVR01021236.1.p1 GENE.GHVR01021236.1~~GHVR01021236.1.p1  ORF type:complete len:148 (+),score=38.65 GHVR01021236.1:192-635(+)